MAGNDIFMRDVSRRVNGEGKEELDERDMAPGRPIDGHTEEEGKEEWNESHFRFFVTRFELSFGNVLGLDSTFSFPLDPTQATF
jgi:hypothetical protein